MTELLENGQAEREPLQRFDAVTEDHGEIDELTRQMFGTSVRVERSDGRPPSLRLAQVAVSDFGVQRVTWNVDGRCDVAPLGRFLCIRLRSGAYGLDQGHGRTMYTAGDTFLADPTRRVDADVVGADLDSFTIELLALEQVAAQIDPRSRGRLDYRNVLPVTPQLGQAWNGVLDHVRQSLWDSDLIAENPLIRAALRHLLVATACTAFDLIPDATPERPAAVRTVRRATTYIDEHLADPITVGDIAVAAGLSVRALHDAFHRVLAIGPSAYLRRARLDAVRHELLDGDIGTTVSDVARRWGFVHLGRFAASYRDEFGELPSSTLRS